MTPKLAAKGVILLPLQHLSAGGGGKVVDHF